MIVPTGLFEITEHLNHSKRGALLVGNIKSGLLQSGMSIANPSNPQSFVLASVEYMDNLGPGKQRVALFLKDSPTFDQLKIAFPVGTKAIASTRPKD